MKKLGIIIDSFSGLTVEEANQLGFYFLPLQVEIDGQKYQDGKDDHLSILLKLQSAKSFFSSLPVLDTIEKTVQEASEKYDDVIVLTLHENLSSTNKYLKTFAAEKANVHVIDNHFSGIQFVNVALFARKNYEEKNMPIDKLIKSIAEINQDSLTLLVPKNLDYMIKGGRLTGVKKLILSTISMVPLLNYDIEGKVSVLGLKRTLKGVIGKLFDKTNDFIIQNNLTQVEFNWMHGIDEEVNNLVKKIASEKAIAFKHEQLTSSVVAVHTGPEAFSVTVMPKLETN
ncbi:DegV family protein [Mycoplasmopsis glycophila]|uniref:Fatty acid-binding protein DegV-like protein n=1 Tax=Mycoplasmopsis glycophila TaxID=171285 RepID=A0A449AV39_9BACT|nr:DegV family protein [Mycoplasmopsis glycophila]VEU70356.1 fatty acid-binding protein DegV-like protein [Mycoplasmopsis glycophila]